MMLVSSQEQKKRDAGKTKSSLLILRITRIGPFITCLKWSLSQALLRQTNTQVEPYLPVIFEKNFYNAANSLCIEAIGDLKYGHENLFHSGSV